MGALLIGGIVSLGLRRAFARRIPRWVRVLVAFLSGITAVVVILMVPLRNALELHVIDVGQGDAVALRFPSGG